MSPHDISKTGAAHPARAIARDLAGNHPTGWPDVTGSQVDKGLAVQTGGRVTAGPVPVEEDRVVQIREALREGKYPIIPARIADAIIAARHMLSHGQ